MFGTGLVGCDKRQIDLSLHRRRQLALGLLCRLLEALERHAILAQVYPLVLSKLIGQVVHYPLVKIVAPEERITVSGLHLEHAIPDFKDGDVERAAAQVKDRDLFVLFLVKPVGQRGSSRLINDTQHIQPSDPPSVFGRLALRVVEVGRNRNHRLGHFLT